MPALDPIKQGPQIFLEAARIIPKGTDNPLRDIKIFKKYLDELLRRSKGLIIVDFLDLACWDFVHSASIDERTGTVELVWRDHTGTPRKEIELSLFPADRYTLHFHFQSVLFVNINGCPIPLIQGYAQTKKDLRKQLCAGYDESDVCGDKLFSAHVYRRKGKEWDSIRCLTSPIISIALIPKGHFMDALDSKVLLYDQNAWQGIRAISRILSEVKGNLDSDAISEKGNSLRRIAEQLLKVECSFRGIEPKKEYEQLLLGDLFPLLKAHHKGQFEWGKIARLSNHLSHDSGRPKKQEELVQLIALILIYANTLQSEIVDSK